jgi:hypothetical protein
MTVYVAGVTGDTPDTVADSLEGAISKLLDTFTVPNEDPPDLVWTCRLVDDWFVKCTATLGEKTLYVEGGYDIVRRSA